MMNNTIQSRGFEYGVKHFLSTKSGLISDILVETLNLDKSLAEFLINMGAVYVQNIRTTLDQPIEAQQLLRVHTKPRRFDTNYDWSSRVIYEDRDFVVVNKPSSLPSHPSVDNIKENTLTAVSEFLKTPLTITHRLDSLTEGLIVYSKNQFFTKAFNELLVQQQIEKKYVALVAGHSNISSPLIHYMEPSPRAPKKLSDHFVDKWAYCELRILEQKPLHENTWIKIDLITGRTHQIRSQLSHVGHPIMGDQAYGSTIELKNEKGLPRISLKAQEIEFTWAQKVHKFELSEDI